MGSRSKRALASEAWRVMAGFTFERFKRGSHRALLEELDLTLGHMKALLVLDPDVRRPMRALAATMAVDASMATWLVDRLEERGLVERRSLPGDRRVKAVALTPRGIAVRERFRQALYEPPPELLALDAARLEAVVAALATLPASAGIMGERAIQDDDAPAAGASVAGANPATARA